MKNRPPPALWIAAGILAVMAVIHVVLSFDRANSALFIVALAEFAITVGLVLGHKWAYFATLLFGVAGVIAAVVMVQNPCTVLAMNGLVCVPLFIASGYFFPSLHPREKAPVKNPHVNAQ